MKIRKDFIDQIKCTLDIMHVSDKEALEIATEIKGCVYIVVWSLEESRGTNAPSATWEEFKKAFLDHYLQLQIREAYVDQFLNLHQGNMSVR